jgi:dsRNA-specific ribonuclease
VEGSEDSLRDLGQRDLEKKLLDLLSPVEQILNYEFKDKYLLLEAFTHRSFKEYHSLSSNYEILEVLGDAILDYIANSNLIKYTILEKYNIEERLS